MSSTAQLIADLFFIRDIGLIMYECYTIKQLVIPKKLDLSSHQKYVTGNAIIMSLKKSTYHVSRNICYICILQLMYVYVHLSRTKVFHTFVWKFMHVRVVRRSRYLS